MYQEVSPDIHPAVLLLLLSAVIDSLISSHDIFPEDIKILIRSAWHLISLERLYQLCSHHQTEDVYKRQL